MSLRDYLSRRRSEIDEEVKALKAELAEISAAENALMACEDEEMAKPGRSGTIKDWVLKALGGAGAHGLDTDGVITFVDGIGGPKVPRSSMTPQLSRLKSAGDIIQVGRQWRLPASERQSSSPLSVEEDDLLG